MPGMVAALSLASGTLLLAFIGAWDDIRPMPALPRLALQAACVALLIGFAPAGAGLFPEDWAPGLGFAIALLAGLWFVNLVNFMDGLDWITVAEMVPVTAALALFGWLGFPRSLRNPARGGAVRGALRVRHVQQARRAAVSRRCRLAADRTDGGVAALSAGDERPCRRCDPAAAVFLRRCHDHPDPPCATPRASVRGPSQPFLPARYRSRLHPRCRWPAMFSS